MSIVHDKLTIMQIADAFGEMVNRIYTEKNKEFMDELMPVYDARDRVNNSPLSDELKTLAHLLNEGLLTDRQKMLFKSLEHMGKVRKMARFYGIGGRRSKEAKVVVMPLEEIKQIPLDQIHDFERIRRNRGGFVATCPFHADRSPSFSVKNNKYKCFSCGKGGTNIDFIMELNGMTFIDAVKWLQKLNYRGGL
jgi:hypothetical protein